MSVITVEAGGVATEAFEPVEEAVDAVALFVGLLAVENLYQPVGFLRDDALMFWILNELKTRQRKPNTVKI